MAKTRSSRLKQNGGYSQDEIAQQNKVYLIVSIGFIAAGFIILIEQYVHWGVFFEPEDVMHHEAFFLLFVALGIGLLLGRFVAVKKSKST